MKTLHNHLFQKAFVLLSLLFTGSVMAASGFNTFLLPTPENSDYVVRSQDDANCAPTNVYGDSVEGLCLIVGTDYVPIAVQYDEFYSYSAAVLEFLQDNTTLLEKAVYGDLAPPGAGQGSEDVVVYTNSSGTSNDPVGPNLIQNDANCLADPGCFILEDPAATDVGSDQVQLRLLGPG